MVAGLGEASKNASTKKMVDCIKSTIRFFVVAISLMQQPMEQEL